MQRVDRASLWALRVSALMAVLLGSNASMASTDRLLRVDVVPRSGIVEDGKTPAFIVALRDPSTVALSGVPSIKIISGGTRGNPLQGITGSTFAQVIPCDLHPLDTVSVRRQPGASQWVVQLGSGNAHEDGGWYMCEASVPGADGKPDVVRTGVVVNAEAFKPAWPEPKDFDEFWDSKKALLAASPATPTTREVDAALPGFECLDLEIPCPGFAPARGYYVRPVNARPGSCPAIILFHAAGVSGDWCRSSVRSASKVANEYGAIVLDLNAHGMLNGQPPEYYEDLERESLGQYSTLGLESRDTWYFVGMYMRAMRAVDFLCAQPEWDGRHVVAFGASGGGQGSMGGGQALAIAGLDARVSAVVAEVPAMCDFAAPLGRRMPGFPKPLRQDIGSEEFNKILQSAIYCDNVYLSARSRAETLVFLGLTDMACPPPGVYAAFNALKSVKGIVAFPHRGHGPMPAEDAWIGSANETPDEFIRRHIGMAAPDH